MGHSSNKMTSATQLRWRTAIGIWQQSFKWRTSVAQQVVLLSGSNYVVGSFMARWRCLLKVVSDSCSGKMVRCQQRNTLSGVATRAFSIPQLWVFHHHLSLFSLQIPFFKFGTTWTFSLRRRNYTRNWISAIHVTR